MDLNLPDSALPPRSSGAPLLLGLITLVVIVVVVVQPPVAVGGTCAAVLAAIADAYRRLYQPQKAR